MRSSSSGSAGPRTAATVVSTACKPAWRMSRPRKPGYAPAASSFGSRSTLRGAPPRSTSPKAAVGMPTCTGACRTNSRAGVFLCAPARRRRASSASLCGFALRPASPARLRRTPRRRLARRPRSRRRARASRPPGARQVPSTKAAPTPRWSPLRSRSPAPISSAWSTSRRLCRAAAGSSSTGRRSGRSCPSTSSTRALRRRCCASCTGRSPASTGGRGTRPPRPSPMPPRRPRCCRRSSRPTTPPSCRWPPPPCCCCCSVTASPACSSSACSWPSPAPGATPRPIRPC